MGEVYRAKDTRLGRDVAIKILPKELSADAARKQRFEREAKTISGLNHPNICTLHDVGRQDGVDYLVMECVEGETLAARLQKGPMPLEQVLRYGAQIADALDKAHRAGIVHRDLKPGNVMLTDSGTKLLDFGLAKPAATAISGLTLTGAVPTSPVTQEGTIVGTFQYMSPEQVEGKEVDGRSDIFSLGAVLYEMVTGKKAFEGKSQLSLASAILEKEPAPITTVKPLTPATLEHAVKKSLAKLPDERWQSASDLASELKWIAESGQDGAPRGVASRPRKLRLAAVWVAMTLLAVASAIVATYYATRPALESPLLASVIPPPGVFADTSGRIGPPQISPDGKRLAFIGCKTEAAATSMLGGRTCSIWLRVLTSSEAHEVSDTSGAYYPFWSPDSHEIAFFADGKLKRVAAEGGPVQVICDAPDARGGSWGGPGTIIFSATRTGPVLRVPAEGGTPVAVTQVKRASEPGQATSNRWPKLLPDGEHFLYMNAPNGACSDLSELHFASLDGKQDVSVLKTCSSAAFANGYLLYWSDGNLTAQPFNAHTGVLSGVPAAVVEHVTFDPLFSIVEFSVSAEGKLVFMAGDAAINRQLQWYDRNGKLLGTLGENDQYKSVSISRDGSRIVADTIRVKESRILILDARGTRTLMTVNNSFGASPTWSADGRGIYFILNPNGPQDIYVRAADGSGEPREVVKFEKNVLGALFLAVSPDGKYLAYTAIVDPLRGNDIYTVALGGDRKPQPFLNTSARETAPAFSPDGKWLAYESDGTGRNEVYITPFPGGGAQYQVSTGGGERPVWRRDGKEIYYREGLMVMAVEVKVRADSLELSPPTGLFELAAGNLNGRYYDVAPDGRFLANTSPLTAKAQSFSLVVNWPTKLNK
jgi:serine/threonine protein kinase/Tol biopolymer transport system component